MSTIEDYSLTSFYDLVVSTYAFHWVEGVEVGLKNIYDSLRPGGRAYLLVTTSKKELPFRQALDRVLAARAE